MTVSFDGRLQNEIAQWLDVEWIPRDVHRRIGEVAGSVVLEARESGMHDATGILFKVNAHAAVLEKATHLTALCSVTDVERHIIPAWTRPALWLKSWSCRRFQSAVHSRVAPGRRRHAKLRLLRSGCKQLGHRKQGAANIPC